MAVVIHCDRSTRVLTLGSAVELLSGWTQGPLVTALNCESLWLAVQDASGERGMVPIALNKERVSRLREWSHGFAYDHARRRVAIEAGGSRASEAAICGPCAGLRGTSHQTACGMLRPISVTVASLVPGARPARQMVSMVMDPAEEAPSLVRLRVFSGLPVQYLAATLSAMVDFDRAHEPGFLNRVRLMPGLSDGQAAHGFGAELVFLSHE